MRTVIRHSATSEQRLVGGGSYAMSFACLAPLSNGLANLEVLESPPMSGTFITPQCVTRATLKVDLTCEGCCNAVTRLLRQVPNVTEVECDLETKTVKVTAVTDEDTFDANDCVSKLTAWAEASKKSVNLEEISKVF